MAFSVPQDNTTFVDLLVYTNSVTDNVLGMGILISVFIILFISLKIFATEKAFAAASFITAIISIFLFTIGILDTIFMWGSIIMAIAGFIGLYVAEKQFG